MPEIAEVARIVHFLKQSVVGKRIASATAVDDGNVFGKVGTSGVEVEESLKGKEIVSAGSQGKYFWITFDEPPHLVMHFGMTGWMHIKGERTAYTNYYKKMKSEEMEQWPPKFWKFHFTTEGKTGEQVAFTDARRFGRVRLVKCPGKDIRKYSPLVENGPDPVQDLDVFTEAYLHAKMRARHVPLKALLLDQATISGIGNWVADETLYHAKLHPEQYCDDVGDAEAAALYASIRHVCQTAVDKLGDSDAFPDDWLFNYRWGKGDKSASSKLPNGEKLAFITVGGRTSCYAPGVQRKTGRVAPGVKMEDGGEEEVKRKGGEQSANTSKKRKAAPPGNDQAASRKGSRVSKVKKEEVADEENALGSQTPEGSDGRRRSTRLRN